MKEIKYLLYQTEPMFRKTRKRLSEFTGMQIYRYA